MLIEEIAVPVGEQSLEAKLFMPEALVGFVIISGRDAHTEHLAALFATRRIATLLVDAREDLVAVLDSVIVNGLDRGCPIGVLGVADAAATALLAASRRPDIVTAVVACGSRREVSIGELEANRAATLFIVGSSDLFGMQLARAQARKSLASTHVVVVPGANAAFSQPGALDEVAELASLWFEEHFRRQVPAKIAAAR